MCLCQTLGGHLRYALHYGKSIVRKLCESFVYKLILNIFVCKLILNVFVCKLILNVFVCKLILSIVCN